jgi:ubiquinone/menaquinone biosynthesis C-methylase UbiE
MAAGQNPWDDEYRNRGRLWGGSTPRFPRLRPSDRVLELGCGNGKTVSSLSQAGCHVTAIDISPHAASLCRKTSPDPDMAGILVADCREMPFRQESFDVVYAAHITGHLLSEGRCQLAREVLRLLRPGGTVCFCDFSTEDFRYRQGRETEEGTFVRKNGIITHYFTEKEVMTLFTSFTVQSLVQHRWDLRVKGEVFPRAEIVAELKKPG